MVDEARWAAGQGARPASPEELIAATLARLQRAAAPAYPAVINATGVLIHTNLGRAPRLPPPLPPYLALEFDLQLGERGERLGPVVERLVRYFGAEAAMVVTNNAAALVLLAACASTPPPAKKPGKPATRPGTSLGSLQADGVGREILMYTLSLLDIDYKFGGSNPEAGLDCSGMVAYIYQNAARVKLPHNAAQIAGLARPISNSQPVRCTKFDMSITMRVKTPSVTTSMRVFAETLVSSRTR